MTDEDFVKNSVMDEEFGENRLMDAKIGPKVVMDLSMFKIGGWNNLQPSNQKLLEEYTDEKEPWFLNSTHRSILCAIRRF